MSCCRESRTFSGLKTFMWWKNPKRNKSEQLLGANTGQVVHCFPTVSTVAILFSSRQPWLWHCLNFNLRSPNDWANVFLLHSFGRLFFDHTLKNSSWRRNYTLGSHYSVVVLVFFCIFDSNMYMIKVKMNK